MVWSECGGLEDCVVVWRVVCWFIRWYDGLEGNVVVWRECGGMKGVWWFGGSVVVWRGCGGLEGVWWFGEWYDGLEGSVVV